MPPIVIELLGRARSFFKNMADEMSIIYAEKGITPFKKPLVVAVPTLLILYLGVYSPMGDKLKSASSDIKRLEVVAQNFGDYSESKSQLAAYQSRLPLVKDKEEWLNYLLTSTGKKCGISFDGISAQTESEAGSFLVVSRKVTVVTTYENIGRWIAEIENSPIFLRINSFTCEKDRPNPGKVKVEFTLSTIFPKNGGRGG